MLAILRLSRRRVTPAKCRARCFWRRFTALRPRKTPPPIPIRGTVTKHSSTRSSRWRSGKVFAPQPRPARATRGCAARGSRRDRTGGAPPGGVPGRLDLLDGREQPVAATAADESPDLLGFGRRLRIAADDVIGLSRRAAQPHDVIDRAPLHKG